MNNFNEASRRIPLREQRAARRNRRGGRSAPFLGQGGFITRLNICITIAAAVILLSKINTGFANDLTARVSNAITENLSFGEAASRIKELCLSLTSEKAEVFSEADSDIDKTITEQIEQNRLMEEQLKNK